MGDNKLFKRALVSAICTLSFAVAGTANAVDWLMLQGTEPEAASAPVKVWGFIQTDYQRDFSPAGPAGVYATPKLLGPNLNSQSGFNISKVRFGARGTGFPIDDHINYFLLIELGNNGITASSSSTGAGTAVLGSTVARLTDASITMNYIPGARIRTGLFKYPGAEEGLQGFMLADYIDFSEATNAMLLERFPNAQYTTNMTPSTPAQFQTTGGTLNGFNAPVGAFRDTGIQVFDSFDMGKDWALSYAAMVGQGSGIQFNNVDGKYDTYLYLSTEKNLGGAGLYANGLKFFAWNQSGLRMADVTNDSIADPKFYKRDRSGLGVKYMAKPYRVAAEYITANGMIFEGPDKPSFYFAVPPNAANLVNNGATAKANGWYLDGGWYIPNTKWELDVRYDTLDANTGLADEHKFNKWTLGTQFHFNPMTKVIVNYEMRDFKCTGAGVVAAGVNTCSGTANGNLSGVGNKLGVQLTAAF